MWSSERRECEEPSGRGYCLLAYDCVLGNFRRHHDRNRIVGQVSNRIAMVPLWHDQLQGLRSLYAKLLLQRFQRSLQILAVICQCNDLAIIPNQPAGLSRVGEKRHRFWRPNKHQHVNVRKNCQCHIDRIRNALRGHSPEAALRAGYQHFVEEPDVTASRDLASDGKRVG